MDEPNPQVAYWKSRAEHAWQFGDRQAMDLLRAHAALAKIRDLCSEPRPWDERDADSAEARVARAYNSALAQVAAVLDAASSGLPPGPLQGIDAGALLDLVGDEDLTEQILGLIRYYPRRDGPHLILGPELFTGDGEEVDQDVIMWRGVAYVRAPERDE